MLNVKDTQNSKHSIFLGNFLNCYKFYLTWLWRKTPLLFCTSGFSCIWQNCVVKICWCSDSEAKSRIKLDSNTFLHPKLAQKSKSPQKFQPILSLQIDAFWTGEDITGEFWTSTCWKADVRKSFRDLSCRGQRCMTPHKQKNPWPEYPIQYRIFSRMYLRTILPVHMLHCSPKEGGSLGSCCISNL